MTLQQTVGKHHYNHVFVIVTQSFGVGAASHVQYASDTAIQKLDQGWWDDGSY